MASFAQFGADLDKSTQDLLKRGVCLTELLKQRQYCPMPMEEQVVSIFAGVRGYLDDILPENIQRFEERYLSDLRREKPSLLTMIRHDKKISEETEKELSEFLNQFKENFV